MTQRERQILNWIEADPMISQQELADKAGITRSSKSTNSDIDAMSFDKWVLYATTASDKVFPHTAFSITAAPTSRWRAV